MKKYFFIPLLLSIAIGAHVLIKKTRAQEAVRIAILTPTSHAALDEIILGFQETLHKKLPCSFEIYNAHGDRVLLRNQAESIVQGDYTLALVIATQPSFIMREVITQRHSQLPVVCTAVDESVGENSSALTAQRTPITTVIENHDAHYYTAQLGFLQKVLPNARKLLLVYSPNVKTDKEKELLVSSCRQKGITLTILPIYASYELAQRVQLLAPGHDCVIILKDNTIVSCIETLINTCNRLRIPLYASDLNSLKAGAALAYGVHEYQFGAQAAHKAYAIVHDKKRPDQIPTTSVGPQVFMVNEKALQNLGISYVAPTRSRS